MDHSRATALALPLLVVSGPPGAGKSTVAPLVASRLGSPSACIEMDWFWTTVTSGFIPPWEPSSDQQNQTVLRSAVSAAAEMAKAGYRVVLEGVVGTWHLPTLVEVLTAGGIDLDYIVLRPDLATCLARAAGRAGEPARAPGRPPLVDSGPIRHLWDQFADLGPYESQVIETADLTAAETADHVIQLFDGGQLRVGAGS